MNFTEFFRNNKVDFTYSTIGESEIASYEKIMGVKMGSQLKEYILKYGFTAFEYIEMFGINSIRAEKSNMVLKTVFLHSVSEKTKGMVAVEDQGDGDYYLVDSDDNVYRFVPSIDLFEPVNTKLFDYILARFMSLSEEA